LLNLSSKLAVGSNTLTLNGNFTGSATNSLTLNGTSNIVVGPSASDITLFIDQTTNGTTNRLNNLTYNRTGQNITLNDTLRVAGNITPTAGTLQTGGRLVLVSDASGTANFLAGTGTYINGSVRVQRFVPSVGRRWRFIGSSVPTATIEDLRNEIFITGPGTGTTVGTLNSNGFDATQTNNATVLYYNESDPDPNKSVGWLSPGNTTDLISPGGLGARIFVRGDRSDINRLNSTNTTQNAVTMDVYGSINTGDFDFTPVITYSSSGSPSEDGWNLLANPYPCNYNWNISFDDITTSTNIEPTVWVYNSSTGNYDFYNALTDAGGLTGGIIPAGCSFWVKATTIPTLTFKEIHKTSATSINVYKSTENSDFMIRLVRDSINSDKLFVKYKTGSTVNKDQYDVLKFFGGVSISAWGADSQYLALSCRPLNLTTNDTIRLAVWGSAGSHTMEFHNSAQLGVTDNVYLVDNFTNTFTNIKATGSYSFSITSNANSQGMGRFYLVVQTPSTVPVTLVDFRASATSDNQVRLNWATQTEVNSDRFEVERSEDGINYETISEQRAAGNSSQMVNYVSYDNNPRAINYYRLKQIDLDGTSTYSQVRKVVFGLQATEVAFEVYPNPVADWVTIRQQGTISSVKVIDGMGITVMNLPGNGQQSIEVDLRRLVPGFYFIETTDEQGAKQVQGITKE
jgi:hypothetical protein